MQRLLILSCSQRKSPDEGLLPAVERYDGPAYRVLRKYLREAPQSVDSYVLSARYGFTRSTEPLPAYDDRITPERALALRPSVSRGISEVLANNLYARVFLFLGPAYVQVLEDSLFTADNFAVKWAQGSIGERVSQLYDWLHGRPPLPPHVTKQEVIQLRGIDIPYSDAEARELCQRALRQHLGQPDSFKTWYVQLDNRRVAPKWFVSQLTQLPPGAFSTSEARRVLAQLGIEVKRV